MATSDMRGGFESVGGARPLSIGKMAQLNGTTVKTLRLYHEMGLIEPAAINPQTGYRAYYAEQSLEFDFIQRLQSMGFSLSEVKSYLGMDKELDRLRFLHHKLEAIERRMGELKSASDSIRYAFNHPSPLSAGGIVEGDRPEFGSVILRWQGRRGILVFDIKPQAFSPRLTQVEVNDWYRHMHAVKDAMIRMNIPLVLYHDVSICIDAEALVCGEVRFSRLYIPVDTAYAARYSNFVMLPEGFYLTTSEHMVADANGGSLEYRAICRLASYAREHGYDIRGDMLDEGDVLVPFNPHEATNKVARIQLPVNIDHAW